MNDRIPSATGKRTPLPQLTAPSPQIFSRPRAGSTSPPEIALNKLTTPVVRYIQAQVPLEMNGKYFPFVSTFRNQIWACHKSVEQALLARTKADKTSTMWFGTKTTIWCPLAYHLDHLTPFPEPFFSRHSNSVPLHCSPRIFSPCSGSLTHQSECNPTEPLTPKPTQLRGVISTTCCPCGEEFFCNEHFICFFSRLVLTTTFLKSGYRIYPQRAAGI